MSLKSPMRFRPGFPSARFRGPPSDVRDLRSGMRRCPPAASRPESCADGRHAGIAASPVRSATGPQIALFRPGRQSRPAFRPRRAAPGPGSSPPTAPSRTGADHGPLPQGPRTRFNGEAIRMPPPGPSARGVSRNPEGAIREACAWPDPAPPISPGPPASSPASSMTARRLTAARPSVAGSPWKRRLSQRPRARFARAGEDAGAPRGTARRNRAPQPTRGLARLSRNSWTAPVPEARPHRVPQIPQLRIPRSGSGRTPRRPARLSRNSRSAPVPGARTPRVPRIPQSRIRAPRRSAAPPPRTRGRPASRKSRNCESRDPGSGRTPPVRFAAPRRERTAAFARPVRRAGATANSAGTAPHRVRGGATASRRGRRVRWPRGCARRGRRAAGRPCGRRPTRRRRRTPGRRRARGIRG